MTDINLVIGICERQCNVCYSKDINLYKCVKCVCLLCTECLNHLYTDKRCCPNCRQMLSYYDETAPQISKTGWIENYSCGFIKIMYEDDQYKPFVTNKVLKICDIILNDELDFSCFSVENFNIDAESIRDKMIFTYNEKKSSIEMSNSIDKPTIKKYRLYYQSNWKITNHINFDNDTMRHETDFSFVLEIKYPAEDNEHRVFIGNARVDDRYVCLLCKTERNFKIYRYIKKHLRVVHKVDT